MRTAADILLGLGSSLDYDMGWQPTAITALAAEWGISSWPVAPARIRDERDLLCAILAYSADGIGTERAVDSVDIIESTARRFGFRPALGGTGVRAGRVLEVLGLDCTIHLTSLSAHTELLLGQDAEYLAGRQGAAAYPHLIVQYRDDQPITIGGVPRTPPRPNRLIFVNDPENAVLALSPDLHEAVRASSLWLISGFNAITDQPHLVRRLEEVVALTRTMRPGGWAVYEDGGFHRDELSDIALSAMAGACDIVSMNEDEFTRHLAEPVDLDDARSVRSGLTQLAERWGIRNLVVHTARWAAALGTQAPQLRPALTQGVLAGAARFSYGDAMTGQDVVDLASAPLHPTGAVIVAELERAGVVAVAGRHLTPEEPVTVGLGDSFVGGFLAGLHVSGGSAGVPRRAAPEAR